MTTNNLTLSFAPHIRGCDKVKYTMLDVIIALIPALIGGIYFFGINSLILTVISVASCITFEYLWCILTKKPNTTGDLSAVITGLLLAFSVPPTLPAYMIVAASAFSIIIVKCCFGGIGQNIVNPALAGRAFLLAGWPSEMTKYVQPNDAFSLFSKGTADAVTGATPLSYIKGLENAEPSTLSDMFFGNVSGCIGEVSAFLLLIGGLYLIVKRVINPVIPITYLVSLGLFGMIFGSNGGFLYHILAGGAFLGAFFMATDYTTTPVTKTGMFVFALGAGILTGVIRIFGGYPEGVTYAILFMNVCVPLIDKKIMPRVFGH